MNGIVSNSDWPDYRAEGRLLGKRIRQQTTRLRIQYYSSLSEGSGQGAEAEEKQGRFGVATRSIGTWEQQVVDAKERSTDVKSWGNKKVTLIPEEGVARLIKACDNKRQEGLP